jgi:uncharacterized protein YciI
MQFLILAHDGTDPEAKSRRMAARPKHLELAQTLKAEGKLIAGGTLLDEAGEMVGSTLYVDFPDRAAVDAWLETDPYVTGDVWRDIEVKPIRLAVMP